MRSLTQRVGQNREPYLHTRSVYGRTFGDFPAKITVYAPYIYGSGHLYLRTCSLRAMRRSMDLLRLSMKRQRGLQQPYLTKRKVTHAPVASGL